MENHNAHKGGEFPGNGSPEALAHKKTTFAHYEQSVGEFRHFSTSFEVSVFYPCGMSSHAENVEGVGYKDLEYWLTSTPDSGYNEQLKTFYSVRAPTGRLKTYVKFVETISPTKQNGYGHLNMYSNQITVTEILDMKPWDDTLSQME